MDKETLIQRLNEDLAGELGAIVQYVTYAAKVTGPYRPQLSHERRTGADGIRAA